ncbi:hypothetical protein [Nostoc edaphicum]|nr:hypothetical protein [Nostoc edaphicum]
MKKGRRVLLQKSKLHGAYRRETACGRTSPLGLANSHAIATIY